MTEFISHLSFNFQVFSIAALIYMISVVLMLVGRQAFIRFMVENIDKKIGLGLMAVLTVGTIGVWVWFFWNFTLEAAVLYFAGWVIDLKLRAFLQSRFNKTINEFDVTEQAGRHVS